MSSISRPSGRPHDSLPKLDEVPSQASRSPVPRSQAAEPEQVDSPLRHRRGVHERLKSLTSRNKILKTSLASWKENAPADRKISKVATRVGMGKRFSSSKLDLHAMDVKSLPDLKDLRMLKHLVASGNKLEQLPAKKDMPPRLVRIDVLGNPLTKLPEDFGNIMRTDKMVFDKERGVLTIPLEGPPDATGKAVALEFQMVKSEPLDFEEEFNELNNNYSFMTGLSWSDGKEADHSGLEEVFFPRDSEEEALWPRDSDERGNGSFMTSLSRNGKEVDHDNNWDRESISSEKAADGSVDSNPTYDPSEHQNLVGTTENLEGISFHPLNRARQDLEAIRGRLCELTEDFQAEFRLNAILVHPRENPPRPADPKVTQGRALLLEPAVFE